MSNILEQRGFFQGMNDDTRYTSFEDGEYLNSQNFRFGEAIETNNDGRVMSSVPGTTLLFQVSTPSGSNFNHGSIQDQENRRVIYFVFNTAGFHSIQAWDTVAQLAYTVLLDAQVVGGLKFQDLNYISSCFVINGNLYWVDNFNGPRRININAGINLNQPGTFPSVLAYTSPLNLAVIRWIRRQPGLPPTTFKSFDVTALNNVSDDAYQFCWRYIYRDYEISTLSGLSTTVNNNAKGDPNNLITVTLPIQEQIDQDVIQIDLVAKYFSSGIYFIIKSWYSVADAAAIALHNSGTTALSFPFYNKQLGIALDSSYSVKPFDSVPLLAQACEVAKNRTFMANYLIGYNTPSTTSLTLSLINNVTGQITGIWIFFQFQAVTLDSHGNPVGSPVIYSNYLIDISTLDPTQNNGYYVPVIGGIPPFPAHINYSQVQFVGAGVMDVMNHFSSATRNTPLQFVFQNATSIIDNAPSGPVNTLGKIFKSDSPYQAGITFYDNAGRKCGVLTNSTLVVNIPDRTFGNIQNTTAIQWMLSNTNAVNEIPSFANYYSIDITTNQRTFFFVQGLAQPHTALVDGTDALIYVGLDATNKFTFTTHIYATNVVGIGIDITCLTTFGMGYTLSAGDVVKLYLSLDNGATYNLYRLKVLNQQAQWLIVEPLSVGTLNGAQAIFEIYTPFIPSITQGYFECGQIFPVNNPGTANRVYSVTIGKINGDTYITQRKNSGLVAYNVETMNPNDKFYKNWNTDAGRPNFIDPIGQVQKSGSLAFSNTIASGTRINGLSTYDALDTVDMPVENGSIQYLQLASKLEKLASVMLAICKYETVSLYLSESVVNSPQGVAFLSATTDVIGTIYPLKGGFGTLNPESVEEWRGNVYWYDAYNGSVIQYSPNGLEPISRFRMKRFWRNWSIQYLQLSPAQIEALSPGNRPYVVGGIDPFNGEYLLSIPQVTATNPNGSLPGFANNPPDNLFDVYDGDAKTMVFKIESNRWLPTLGFVAEGLCYVANQLYGFSSASLYLHNDINATYNNFYGINYIAKLMFPSVHDRNNVKVYNAISVEADLPPTYGLMYNTTPNTQCTDFDSTTFRNNEGIFYSAIYRDRNSPAFFPDFDGAWSSGDKMRSKSPRFEVDFAYNVYFTVRYVNLNYILSIGHRVLTGTQKQQAKGTE